jgi:hypothetical protein
MVCVHNVTCRRTTTSIRVGSELGVARALDTHTRVAAFVCYSMPM